MPESLPGQLSRQVERVSVLRERYRSMNKFPRANVAPAITLMDASLEAAHNAAACGDIGDMVTALRDLNAFQG